MVRIYRAITIAALAVIAAVFGLVVLASVGVLEHLELRGVSLWPHVVIGAFIAFAVACWALAKAKGLSGWIGLASSLADISGFWWLVRHSDSTSNSRREGVPEL
jgi:hypothetical protein